MTRSERVAIDVNTVKSQGSTLAEMQAFMTRYTGLLPGITLAQTTNNANITTTANGQVIENLEVLGRIIVNHADVIIRNVWVRGRSDTAGHFIECGNSTRNLLIEDVQIGPPRNPTAYGIDGIAYRGHTSRRVRIIGPTDGFNVSPDSSGNCNVLIEGCWLENMTKVCPDDGHTDGTHNDGLQWHMGANVTMRGCLVQGRIHPTTGNTGGLQTINDNGVPACLIRNTYGTCTQTNAVLMFSSSDTARPAINGMFENNWFDGGMNTLNSHANLVTPTGQQWATIQNNIFTKRNAPTGTNTGNLGQYTPVTALAPINIRASAAATITGNVYEDGTAVEIDRP
jgi:hypothetical protein